MGFLDLVQKGFSAFNTAKNIKEDVTDFFTPEPASSRRRPSSRSNSTRPPQTTTFESKPQPNQTPIPATDLNKDVADVNAVQDTIRDASTPVTTAGFGRADRTVSVGEEPIDEPEKTDELSIRDQIQEGILSALGQDTTEEKAQLRADAGIEEKAKTSNRILNQLRTMRVDYESKKDVLENTNEAGRSMGAINNDINKLTKDTNRNLAYKSIEFDIANNDLRSAEATVSARIQDMKDEEAKQVALYKTLFDFVQDDMSASEKLEAQQAFAEKTAERSFERKKELADYNSLLRKDEASFAQNLKNAVTAQEAEDASQAILPSLKQKAGDINEAMTNLKEGDTGNVVGAHALARFSLTRAFSGKDEAFIGAIDQLTSRETLDTLIALKAKGGTLGALSQTELNMLESSASKIGTWRMRNEEGQTTGYKIDEASFNKELKTLRDLTNKAIIKAGGDINADPLGLGINSDPLELGI